MLFLLFFQLLNFFLTFSTIFIKTSYSLFILSPDLLHLLLIFFNLHFLWAYFLLVLIDDFSILLRKLDLFVEFKLEILDLRVQSFFFIWFIIVCDDLSKIGVTFFEKHFMNVGLIFIRVTYIVGVTLFSSMRINLLYNTKPFWGIFGRHSFDKLTLLIIFRLECLNWWEVWHSRMSDDIL